MSDPAGTRDDTDLNQRGLGGPLPPEPTIRPRTVERVEALAASAAQGDIAALEQLYETCVDSCYRFVYVRTHSHHLSEEITSETWLSIVRHISGYRLSRGAGFTAWMFTIARHKLVDHYRSKVASAVTYTPTADMVDVWVGRAGTAYGDDTVREQVTDLLCQLPSRQRDVVVLRDLIGLTLEEVATVVGRRPAAVRKAHSRAMKRLRESMCCTPADTTQQNRLPQ